MGEDLSSIPITKDWSNISNYLNATIYNYELILSNATLSKKIFVCNSDNEKFFSQRFIAIRNETSYEFRTITLGVCY